jgi:hypothetical protein
MFTSVRCLKFISGFAINFGLEMNERLSLTQLNAIEFDEFVHLRKDSFEYA